MSNSDRTNTPGVYVDSQELLKLRFGAKSTKLFTRKPASSILAGGYRTRFRGRGIDFEEVRQYQPGDDIRTIDWRVTARTQTPHTKVFREERERPVIIVTDQRPPMFFGSQENFKSVTAAQLSACIAWSALANSDRVGALVFGAKEQADIRPKRSKYAVLEQINALEAFSHKLQSPIEPYTLSITQMLEETRRIARPGCALFVISDFHDINATAQQQLYELGRHTDITLVHVYDQLEAQLPAAGLLSINDGRQKKLLNTDSEQVRQQYQRSFEQRMGQLQTSAQELKLPLLQISTRDNPRLWLQKTFSPKTNN